MMAAAARIAAIPAVRRGALAIGVAAAALVALSPGDLAPAAARAALAAGGVFVTWAFVTRRRGGEACRAGRLYVTARTTLAQGTGVAIVEADGRRLLLSFGREGARLVAELAPAPAEGPRP